MAKKKCINFVIGKAKKRNFLEDLEIDAGISLRWTPQK
jgi:hypothetical protein